MFPYYLFYASTEKWRGSMLVIAATAIMAKDHRRGAGRDHEAPGAVRLLLARKR